MTKKSKAQMTEENLSKLAKVRVSTKPEDFKPGRYRHYKGGEYVALQLVHHHETRALMVLYLSLEYGTFNVREYAVPGRDSWTDIVNVGEPNDTGAYTPIARFTYLGPAY